jgi:hypothetical protein
MSSPSSWIIDMIHRPLHPDVGKAFLDKGQALPWWIFTAEGKKLLATKNKRSRP